jgi:hypothetical protein
MRPFLMHADTDFDLERTLPWNEAALVDDLGLRAIVGAMGDKDEFLLEVAKRGILSSTADLDTIRYRQAVLEDCLNNRTVMQRLYDITIEAIQRERKEYIGLFSQYPGAILHRAIMVMSAFFELLQELRRIAREHCGTFSSAGFKNMLATIEVELTDEFFAHTRRHLQMLRFDRGVLISATVGRGLKGAGYVLRRLEEGRWRWLRRLVETPEERGYIVYVHPRDEAGGRYLSELRDRGIILVANALAQSAEHVLAFFRQLRAELGFYLGCARLYDELERRGLPTCFPVPSAPGQRRLVCRGLYDLNLALGSRARPVGNDVDAGDKPLLIVTGANQGGKSVFLRSIGVAQLMMQSGMFVPAESYEADVCDGLFTHYKREEDTTMTSGKFDEELKRMSEIVDHMTPHAMLLFNESFAATNEREGSEIARSITRALVEKGKRVLFVTHLYDFARSVFDDRQREAVFLRADRQPDGTRTFRLVPGEPLSTSFGEDLYRRIFGRAVGH